MSDVELINRRRIDSIDRELAMLHERMEGHLLKVISELFVVLFKGLTLKEKHFGIGCEYVISKYPIIFCVFVFHSTL